MHLTPHLRATRLTSSAGSVRLGKTRFCKTNSSRGRLIACSAQGLKRRSITQICADRPLSTHGPGRLREKNGPLNQSPLVTSNDQSEFANESRLIVRQISRSSRLARPGLRLFQLERLVQSPHRLPHLLLVDQAGDSDLSRISLAFQSIAPGHYFEFGPDCVFDGNYRARLEHKRR